jgi:tetratricopeptide (TPR) repeat protein
MVENPGNRVVKNRYIRFCSDWITFRLLTKERISEDILRRCLRLQKILAALTPDNPVVFVSLANFYSRLKEYEQAISSIHSAIALDPKNQDYQNILKNYAYLHKMDTNGTKN